MMCLARKPRARAAVIVVAAMLIAGTPDSAATAQGPQRTVKIPGTDLSIPGGWQVLFHQGCRFAVPVSWHGNLDGSLAVAPDGSNISIRAFRISSWSAHKAQIKAAFGRVNVMHEDSDRRLWFEIGDKARIQHYVEVLDGLNVCSGLLDVHAATSRASDGTIKRIAESVGAAAQN